MKKIVFKLKMETVNHSNGAYPKSQTSRYLIMLYELI